MRHESSETWLVQWVMSHNTHGAWVTGRVARDTCCVKWVMSQTQNTHDTCHCARCVSRQMRHVLKHSWHTTHGWDQDEYIWIFSLADYLVSLDSLLSDGDSVYSRENLLEILGTPEKMCWYARGFLWKLVENLAVVNILSRISSVCGESLQETRVKSNELLLESLQEPLLREVLNCFRDFVTLI